jgi:RNA polymerase sigma-70 factor, ECF subfamily
MTLTAPDAPALERQWVDGAREGDVAAREQLAQFCHRLAFLAALQLSGNREDAKDLAQDAMVRFFASLDRFDTGRPLRPWLFRIVRNLYRDRLRRRRIRRTSSLDDDEHPVQMQVADGAASPEDCTARHELQRILWEELQQIPTHYREVVVLRDYQDLAYSEIARILRLPRGTVMSRLHRGRQMLRSAVRRRAGSPAEEDDDA